MSARASARRPVRRTSLALAAGAPGREAAALALLALPFLLAFLVKLMLAGGASPDEAEWLLKTQSLQWGYDVENPPLVMWLGWLAQRAGGIGLAPLWALKFALLASFAGALYIAWRAAGWPRSPALAGAAAPLSLYYLAWVPLNHYSHSVLLLPAMAASWALALALLRRRSWPCYLGFGAVAAVGLLAKYNYAVFLAALLAALALRADGRRVLADRRAAAALALALLLALPHGFWMAAHTGGLLQAAGSNLAAAPAVGAVDALAALGHLGRALAVFVLPGAVLLALLVPWRRLVGMVGSGPAGGLRLLAVQTVTGLAILAAIAAASGSARWPVHYFYPIALLPALPALLAARAGPWRGRAAAGIGLLVPLLAVAALPLEARQPWSAPGERHRSYQPLAERLRADGVAGGTLVVVADQQRGLSGALRLAFPQARVLATRWPLTRPGGGSGGAGSCAVVWPGAQVPPVLAGLPGAARQGQVAVPVAGQPAAATVGYALWPGRAEPCRRAFAAASGR